MNTEHILKFLLRLIGSFSLFALIFVAVPYSWMDAIHFGLGMGKLPDEPVVGYLASQYQVPTNSHIRLIVFNLRGEIIKELVDKDVLPGYFTVSWDGRMYLVFMLLAGYIFTGLKRIQPIRAAL